MVVDEVAELGRGRRRRLEDPADHCIHPGAAGSVAVLREKPFTVRPCSLQVRRIVRKHLFDLLLKRAVPQELHEPVPSKVRERGHIRRQYGYAHGERIGELCGHLVLRVDVVRVLEQAHEVPGTKVAGKVQKRDIRNHLHIRRVRATQEIPGLVVGCGFDDHQLAIDVPQLLHGIDDPRNALVHAQGAGEEDHPVLGAESELRAYLVFRIGSAIEIVFAADMRQDYASVPLLKLLVRHGDLIEQGNERLAVPGPGFRLGTTEVPIPLAASHLLECQYARVAEECGLVVIHVEHDRPVPVQLGEDSRARRRATSAWTRR